MNSQEPSNKSTSEKPSTSLYFSLNEEFRLFLQENFKEVRDEIRNISLHVRDSLSDIEDEIQSIKVLAQNNFERLEILTDDFSAVEERESELIMTSLDVLEKIPSHLRRTFNVMLKMGHATALEVSHETEKSRPLESDYLNQLIELGYLKKRKDRKRVIFSLHFIHIKAEQEKLI
ncbi:MAG: hypothetical protein ACW98F_14820 [Candidatus Hodarchaeales archaeon]|jgi:hypothetical protein